MNTSNIDSVDLLTIILDLNPLAWADLDPDPIPKEKLGSNLISVIESILIFSNSHLALRHENAIAIYGASLGSSELLYSSLQPKSKSETEPSSSSTRRDPNTYPTFRVLHDSIISGVQSLSTFDRPDSVLGKPTGIVKALAKAMCHINRITKENDLKKESIKPRILILSISADSPGQYIPMMNCIFSAQKAGIPIDVCKIGEENAVFLQQAAHLTDGIYYRIERPKAILQYLTMIFLPGISARKVLNLPRHEEVDFRAACFCHREIIDIGYVCSVCLSIFCAPTPVCSTCRTKFPLSTLKRFVLEKTRSRSGNGSTIRSGLKPPPANSSSSTTNSSPQPSPSSSWNPTSST